MGSAVNARLAKYALCISFATLMIVSLPLALWPLEDHLKQALGKGGHQFVACDSVLNP